MSLSTTPLKGREKIHHARPRRFTAAVPHPSSSPRPPSPSPRPSSPTTSACAANCRPPRSPARRRDRLKSGIQQPNEPDDHAPGRSRGGLSTKVHLAADGRSRPLAILLTPGQRHDSICARPLLERIHVPRTGPGWPRCRPDQVIVDKSYSSRGLRTYPRKRGIAHTIPQKADQQRHRLNRGLPPAQHRRALRQPAQELPRDRHQIRKTATSYEVAVNLASFLLWARSV
ncbi:transposase [Streptomyces sp. NPDC014344]|uniref:transposase n=1 Tax=Streptomyces sp. NPDC014344 TaxID=3364871 RepID=UPI0036FF5BD9